MVVAVAAAATAAVVGQVRLRGDPGGEIERRNLDVGLASGGHGRLERGYRTGLRAS